MTFDDVIDVVLRNEGGYVWNPKDPGGETKYGISKWAYPGEDIAGMTVERAKELYRRDYWGPLQCDQLPAMVRLSVMDAGVNSGVKRAAQWLQRAVGVADDGIIGAKTIAAARATDPATIVVRLNGARLRFLTDSHNWLTFGQGWTRRVAAILQGI